MRVPSGNERVNGTPPASRYGAFRRRVAALPASEKVRHRRQRPRRGLPRRRTTNRGSADGAGPPKRRGHEFGSHASPPRGPASWGRCRRRAGQASPQRLRRGHRDGDERRIVEALPSSVAPIVVTTSTTPTTSTSCAPVQAGRRVHVSPADHEHFVGVAFVAVAAPAPKRAAFGASRRNREGRSRRCEAWSRDRARLRPEGQRLPNGRRIVDAQAADEARGATVTTGRRPRPPRCTAADGRSRWRAIHRRRQSPERT